MRYVITRMNDYLFASEIVKSIDILQAITWVEDASKEVNVEAIKNCFAKCGITEQSSKDEDDILNEEFNALFNEIANSECDMKVKEHVNFDVKTCSSLLAFNADMVNQRVSSAKTCVIEYLRKEYRDLNEVALNNDDDKVNEDDAKSKDIEVVEINIGEVLTMLDRLVNSKDLSKKERNSRHHERQIREEH